MQPVFSQRQQQQQVNNDNRIALQISVPQNQSGQGV
jgi:hypothetical protein